MVETLREGLQSKDRESLGKELYQRTKELLKKDKDKSGMARYKIVDYEDYFSLQEELRQLGLREFMEYYVGVPLVFISPGGGEF